MGRAAGIRTSVRKIHWFRRPGRCRPRYLGATINLNLTKMCYISWCIYLLIRPTHSKWFHEIYKKKKDCMEQNNFFVYYYLLKPHFLKSFVVSAEKNNLNEMVLTFFCTYLSIYLSIYLFTFMYLFTFCLFMCELFICS